MKKSLLFILIIPSVTLAQTYLAPDGKTRHRFAQTVFGLDMQTSSGGNSVAMAETGSASSFGFPAMPSARIYISGTHFWGHAEFYFAFQISFLKHVYRNVNYDASQSDVFGIKYYPKPIQLKRLIQSVVAHRCRHSRPRNDGQEQIRGHEEGREVHA